MGLVDFREVSLAKEVGETEDVVLYFFACGLILTCVHSALEDFISRK